MKKIYCQFSKVGDVYHLTENGVFGATAVVTKVENHWLTLEKCNTDKPPVGHINLDKEPK